MVYGFWRQGFGKVWRGPQGLPGLGTGGFCSVQTGCGMFGEREGGGTAEFTQRV